MPAGGTTLRSTADYHETSRSSSGRHHHHHQHQHHRLSGSSSYVFAPSWMLRNGKKPPNNDQLAFTSFAGGNNAPQTSFSSRKSDYSRPTVSTLRSSNSSPYPSSWEEEENNNDKPDASEFPTLTSDDTINKRNEGRSAWSNPHLIKEKVLSPTRIDQVSQLDMGPSPEDIEFERLKALVPKQRTATRKIGNRLSSASPSPSSSSSSSHHHHHHRSSHPHPPHQQHSQPHPHHRTSKSSSTHIRATNTTSSHRAPFMKKDHPAIVKISTSTHATTTTITTKRVSSDSGTSTSSSSTSSTSSSSGMQHDMAQQDPLPTAPPRSSSSTTTTTARTPPTPPTTSTTTTTPGHLWVDEREKQHFLSWLYTWTCQPGIEWRKDAHALHHHGEYSYFGPLGTKSDASLFYQGNILVHSPWYNYS
ncbi:hypothetical protein O0I10_009078 [Lichtheimia ornata]|uniref:Uncharacterized protein n=1 Tax=Lichtheimia ornata TaxID=688661 RepID=A0AAD7UXQ5_9FUNG|nr:uncharacterized protein O0I10_009078 [Lichtheimia ornata]KAJ8655210.1 hypothetical protein O0I10_009078 [Lichtheimia ornata]